MSLIQFSRDEAYSLLLNPPGLYLLATGLAGGLIIGSLPGTDSAESATAVGLSWFIGISLGGWLGAIIDRGIMLLLAESSRALQRRINAVRERIERLTGEPLEPSHSGEPVFLWLFSKIGIISIYLSAMAITFSTTLGIILALYQIGGLALSKVGLLILAGGCGLAVAALAMIFFHSLYLLWELHRIEAKVDDHENVKSFTAIESGHNFETDIRRIDRFLLRVTG